MPAPDRPRLVRVPGRDTWHIYHRRRRLSTGCTDRTAAEAVLARYLADLDRPQSATLSVAEILARYLADRREAGKPGAERLGFAHKPLARHFGARPPEAIDEAACRLYARRRLAEGVRESTVRTEMQALRAALRWAAAEKLIPEAPRVTMPGRPRPRDRWLTREEAARLVAACASHHVRLFVVLALNTAARAGAILALTWDRVDLERRVIDFRVPGQTETRKRRVAVPINDTLHAALGEAKALAATEWVVEWGGGRVRSVKHGFRDAAKRAGLAGVTPHTLRHTAATWMAQEGVPMWDIAGMLGNSVEMVTDTYAKWSPEHLRRAAGALG